MAIVEYDLQIHIEDVDRLREELTYIVEFFQGLWCDLCDVLFGFAWTLASDSPDLSWKNDRIPLLHLSAEIQSAEDAGLGKFMRDDLHVKFEGWPYQVEFCHHSGIHLKYAVPDDITEHFFTRWQAEGLHPSQWEKTEEMPKWRRIHDK